MKANQFITWLRRAGARGRTMSQYVEKFGQTPVRALIDAANERGYFVNIKSGKRGGSQNHHRLVLMEGPATRGSRNVD